MQLQMCNVTPNYTHMGYAEKRLAESLFTAASGTSSSPAVDLYMAHLGCCWEAREDK